MESVIYLVLVCAGLAWAGVSAVGYWKSHKKLREMQEREEEFQRLSQLSMIMPETAERMERAKQAEPLTAQQAAREAGMRALTQDELDQREAAQQAGMSNSYGLENGSAWKTANDHSGQHHPI